jgi:hypothetical protein
MLGFLLEQFIRMTLVTLFEMREIEIFSLDFVLEFEVPERYQEKILKIITIF